MKVKDLREALANLPDDMEVILQKDGEGNGYSPLAGADSDSIYVPDPTWDGAVYHDDSSADDNCLEDDEWERLKAGPRCLVLYPVN